MVLLNGGEIFRRRLLLIFISLFHLSSSNNMGAPMGPHKNCDDGKTHLTIDWDPESTVEHTCNGEHVERDLDYVPYAECDDNPEPAYHLCLPHSITYDGIPSSGMHRPVWAAYGEYRYCPPQRWLHNLEHSAIVLLYHPCVNQTEVNPLKKLLRRCVRRHVITPSKLLDKSLPFALLSWGCILIMPTVNLTLAEMYIKNHARDGPEPKTYSSGQYVAGLIRRADTLRGSDYRDSTICPNEEKEYQENKVREQNAAKRKRRDFQKIYESVFRSG